MRSSLLLDAWVLVAVLAAVVLGLYIGLGRGVQARVGTATQRMVNSISHDAKLEDYGADSRIDAENSLTLEEKRRDGSLILNGPPKPQSGTSAASKPSAEQGGEAP